MNGVVDRIEGDVAVVACKDPDSGQIIEVYVDQKKLYCDVTERKYSETDLQESEQKFRTVIDASPVPQCLVDDKQNITFLNKAFTTIFGYTLEDIPTVVDWWPKGYPNPEYRALIVKTWHERVEKAEQTGTLFEPMEATLTCKNGSLRTVIVSATNLWEPFEQFLSVTLYDITERNKATAELQHSNEKLRILTQQQSALFDASPLGIATLLDRRITSVNRAFCEMTGYPEAELINESTRLVYPSQDAFEQTGRLLYPAFAKNKIAHTETDFRRKDGTIFSANITGGLVHSTAFSAESIWIFEDITEKNNVMEQLIQSQKVESIGQLAGGIAHDFNNILSIISGYAYLTKLEMENELVQLPYIEHILTATSKAATLTQSLLAYSRKQVMNPVNQDLNHLITSVGTFITRLIGEHIRFTVSTQGVPLPVCVDSLQIEQVMMNLATNARDAMPNGGTFTISTMAGKIDEVFVDTHEYGEDSNYAIITVTDGGCGMSAATAQRIFDPFYTTKEVGKGTGLGMSMVMGIIKQHRGFIDVHSEIGIGTVFTIYLPLVDESSTKRETDSDLELEPGAGTILVAEDELAVRTYMHKLLTKCGYTVILAVDGQDAVEKYATHKDEIDLVILDMVMPGKSGKAACDEIKIIDGSAVCMFVSGYAGDIIERHGDLGENTVLLTKPIQPHILLSKIAEILKK
jgi:PAS domain S-box-containing protein